LAKWGKKGLDTVGGIFLTEKDCGGFEGEKILTEGGTVQQRKKRANSVEENVCRKEKKLAHIGKTRPGDRSP